MISDNTTYNHFHQEGREAIKKEHLKRKFLGMLQPDDFTDTDRNEFFVDTLIYNFDEIFKIPIDDETYDPDETEVNYIGRTDKWDYEVAIFGRIMYFMCNTPEKMEERVNEELYDNPETLFTYNPVYVCGCLKEEQTHTEEEITFNEPDPETDDVPNFASSECPCCMEEWGMKETTTFVGNHPTRKVLKKTKTFTIKRNTYCGHSLCITCFNKCCEDEKPKCPICRKLYSETGDRVIEMVEHHTNISTEIAQDLFRFQDENLFDLVDIERLVSQSILVDGIGHLLKLEGFEYTGMYGGSEYYFGVEEA